MNFKTLLARIAPVLASLVNSPLGLALRQMLAQFLLGKAQRNKALRSSRANPEAMDDDLSRALERATPEQVAQVQRLETDMAANLSDLYLLNSASKSKQNKSTLSPSPYRDKTPATLAKLITLGFMLILGLMIFVPMAETNRAMDVMLGALSSAWTISVGYYFGEQHKNGHGKNGNGNNSTRSSQSKTQRG